MVEQILRSISRSMSQVGQETGQFRKAAADQNKSIGSFIKDVSKMFSSQNKQQASINSSLDDIQYNSQQTNTKVSQSNDLIQESISIQTQMLSELRSVAKGIGSLIDGLGLGGLGGGGGTGSKIATALMAGGIGATAGVLGSAGYNFLSQQSGVDASNFGGGQFAQTSVGGTTGQILDTIKKVESGGDYKKPNADGTSTSSGAYQFTNPTWQDLTRRYGVGTEFKRAMFAPPDIQDAVAAKRVEEIMAQNNNDVSKIPIVWYTGNAQGKISQDAMNKNRGMSAQAYQKKWLGVWENTAGQSMPEGEKTPEGDGDVMAMSGPVNLQKYSLKPPDHVQGLDGSFQQKLGNFFQDAEASGHDIKLYSGYRSPERQKELFANAVQKYGSPEAARRWVAPPGRSKHNYGLAADLQFLTPGAKEWAHQNASRYGLHFRMGHEPWHIEPIGASSTVPYTSSGSGGLSTPMGGALGFTGGQTGNEGYDQYMTQLGGMGAYGSAAALLTSAGTSMLGGMTGISLDNLLNLFSGSGGESEASANEPVTSEEGSQNIEGDGDVMKVAKLTPQPSLIDNRAMMIEQNASQTQIASQMPSVTISDKTQYGDMQGPTGYTTHAGNMSLNGLKDTTLPDWYRSLFGVGGGRIVPDNDFYKTLA